MGVGGTENGIEIESGTETKTKIGIIVEMKDGMTQIMNGREIESGIGTGIGTLTKSGTETETGTEKENVKEMDGGGRSFTPYLPFPLLPPVSLSPHPFFMNK